MQIVAALAGVCEKIFSKLMNVDSILKLDERSTGEALKYLENTGRSVMWVGQSLG